jgi:O-antigen/teichoic acid export membrane protein
MPGRNPFPFSLFPFPFPLPPFLAMSTLTLKKLAIRGTVWTLMGYGSSQGLRLMANLCLTRLLAPEMFGLMALVNIFILGLTLFSDIGIAPSIIQHDRGDEPDFLNSAWTLQIIRGFCLWLCCLLFAFPVAQFYGEPQLNWLIPIVGFTTVVAGFNSTALFTFQRRLNLGKLTLFELSIQSCALCIMLIWAWFQPSIWALVVGNLVSESLKMIFSHRLIPDHHNRLAWSAKAIADIFAFGKWIFVSTAMTFLAAQTDRLILGKLLSFELLGIYNVALIFAELPKMVMMKIGNQVIFPVISRQLSLPRPELRQKILAQRLILLLVAIPLLAILIGFGDVLILGLYDRRYEDAAWMLPILALGIWPNVLVATISPALLAIGQPLYAAWGNFAKFCYMAIALPLGFFFWGVPGAIIVVACNDFPFYLVVSYGLWRENLTAIAQDLQTTLLLMGLIALILIGRHALCPFPFPFFPSA